MCPYRRGGDGEGEGGSGAGGAAAAFWRKIARLDTRSGEEEGC
jgi:hypothetical protein